MKDLLKKIWREIIKKHIRKWRIAGGMAIG